MITSVKERPIPFSASMVRAILEGRKGQTRRIINRVSGIGRVTEFQRSDTPGYDWIMRDRRRLWNDLRHGDLLSRCPYGKPGDRLWVRETWWRNDGWRNNPGRIALLRNYDGKTHTQIDPGDLEMPPQFVSNMAGSPDDEQLRATGWVKKPSIHMPRWASRILLEVTAVRVERLQAISEEDARAEGIFQDLTYPGTHRGEAWGWEPFEIDVKRLLANRWNSPENAYRALWESINGPGSWDANPWVWVVEFKRVEVK